MKHMETHFGKNEPGKVGVGQEGKKIIHLTRLHQKQGFWGDGSSTLLISSMDYSTFIQLMLHIDIRNCCASSHLDSKETQGNF